MTVDQPVTIDQTVQTVVARQLQVEPETLTHDADLVIDLGVDDDRALSVIVAVEEALDVRFPDDFLDGIQTYGQLSSAVKIAVGG